MLETTAALVTQRIEAMPLLAGRFADPCRLTWGYFAVLFRARDHVTGDEVAIKVLDPTLPALRRASLLREPAILQHLRNTPGVVRCLGEGFDLTVPGSDATVPMTLSCFAMELGGPGLDVTPHEEGWSLARRLRTFRALCRAVRGIHATGVVHRDLKPENVLVVPGSVAQSVAVVDFGVARRHADGSLEPHDVAFLGDPRYTAPELAVRIHEPDARVASASDIYSLGAILHEMVTGRVLADTLDLTDSLAALRNQVDAQPEHRRAATLCDALPDLVRRFPVPRLTGGVTPLELDIVGPLDRLHRGLTALDHRDRFTLPEAIAAVDLCLARLPAESALRVVAKLREREEVPLAGA